MPRPNFPIDSTDTSPTGEVGSGAIVAGQPARRAPAVWDIHVKKIALYRFRTSLQMCAHKRSANLWADTAAGPRKCMLTSFTGSRVWR
jgi:hypothetical protein